MQWLVGGLHLDALELAGVVLVTHGGKRSVEEVIILVDQAGERVANRDVLRRHAHAGKLADQGEDHLRRGIHVILPADEGVGVQVDVALAENHPHPVGLDGDLLTRAVAHITLAPRAVQVAEQPGPCLRHRSLAGQFADRPRHHGVHALLLHPLGFPPVAIVGAFPIGDLGIVDPDDAPRMDALGYAQGLGLALVEARCDGGETNREAAGKGQRLAQEGATVQRSPVDRSGGVESVLKGEAGFAFMGQWDQKRCWLSSVKQRERRTESGRKGGLSGVLRFY